MAENVGEVDVTLLLNGGHTRTLFLNRRDPLLASLLSSIGDKNTGGGRPTRLFNIRVDHGRRSLIFSSTDLVAVITDPPMVSDAVARQPTLPASPGAVGHGTGEKSPYLMMEKLIHPAMLGELLKFVVAREKDFMPSSVSTEDTDYRRSQVLHDFPQFSEFFRDRVRSLHPQLAATFGMGAFPVGDIECQLTASNDGDFFKLHNDNGSPDTVERAISYVYYFNNEPKSFTGGEFRLYNSRIVNGRYECGAPAAVLEPKNNSILFFPSHCHHEVLPVRCPSKRFIDSRFTINGWIRRTAAA